MGHDVPGVGGGGYTYTSVANLQRLHVFSSTVLFIYRSFHLRFIYDLPTLIL